MLAERRYPSRRDGTLPAGRWASSVEARSRMRAIVGSKIRKIVVACDAGMGSSVMLASQLSARLARYSVTVTHSPINSIPSDADLVLCQQRLVDRARHAAHGVVVLGFQMFLGDPLFLHVEEAIKSGAEIRD
jgi:PTS system mannitol-specific IIB component